MAGGYTRMHIVIEGVLFQAEGGFLDVMHMFDRFLADQFGIRLAAGPYRFTAEPKPPKPPKPPNWRKTLGFAPTATVTRGDIHVRVRSLASKLRPDLMVHGKYERKRQRWNRIMDARNAALKEVAQ